MKKEVKKLISDLQSKIKHIQQLDKEHEKLISKIQKLKNNIEYGNIVLIEKKYHQFVSKRQNGKQRKVYIGKNKEKLKEYQQKIRNGLEHDKCQQRINEIAEQIHNLDERVNPKYFF